MVAVRRVGACLSVIVWVTVVPSICHAGGIPGEGTSQKAFYIDIGEAAEMDLVRKVQSLKSGTSVEMVKSLLGEPSVDHRMIGKKGDFRTRILKYAIRQKEKGSLNEPSDRYVSLYFDEADRLTEVKYKLATPNGSPRGDAPE